MTLRRATLVLLIVYALITAYSILGRPLKIAPEAIVTPLVTLAGFAFALLHAGQREGWRGALGLLGLVFGVSLLFESLGVATGWVYGPYHYTDQLGPKFLGLVPYLIPVAWFMMSYPSFVIASRLVGETHHEGHDPKSAGAGFSPRKKNWRRILAVAALGGVVMTAWDVIMDPIMVAGGNWVWEVDGAYFGIPLQNFWGWWLTVFTTFALYLWLFSRNPQPSEPAFDRLALTSYAVAGLGIVLAALLSHTGGLALIGLFAMLPWMVTGWLSLARN
jgi:uncharacterized membrane protein